MKRFCILICICVLLGTLTACHIEDKSEVSVSVVATEDTTETTLTTSETETTTQTEPAETTTEEAVAAYDDQVALMARERENWMPEEEWYNQPYSYAVTDLNQNGRLELMVSSCQGTGIFTITDVYEVSEDGESLIYCVNSTLEGGSQVDLIVAKAPVYYNEENGTYTYLFSDFMRSGWAWNGEDLRAVTLTEGLVTETTIAGVSNEYDMDGNCTSIYYNAEGEIDEAAYSTVVAEYFADCVEMEALFAWQNYSFDEVDAMDTEAWVRSLEASYAGFSVS